MPTNWSQVSIKLPPGTPQARLRRMLVDAICLVGCISFRILRSLSSVADKSEAPKKILMIRRGGVGDFVMLTYLARCLRAAFPLARVYLLTGKQALALSQACPYIDEVLPVPKKAREWFLLIWRLRQEKIDTAFVHHRFFAAPVLAWACGIPRRVGFFWRNHGFALTDGIPFLPAESQVEQAYRLVDLCGGKSVVREAGLVLRDEDISFCNSLLQDSGYDPRRLLIGLHIGGAEAVGNSELTGRSGASVSSGRGPIRRWPPEYFARLADTLVRQENAQVVLFQGPGDETAVRETLDRTVEKPFLVAPPMHIRQFAALVSICDLVVAGDSGPMHIAVAFNTPVLAIFGPSHPGHSGPLGQMHRIAWAGAPCSPCWSSEEIAVMGKWNGAKMPQCWRQTHECMLGLLPETVHAIVREQLSAIAVQKASTLESCRSEAEIRAAHSQEPACRN